MSSSWVYIKDLKDYLDKKIILKGWMWNKRSSGKIAFLQIRDGYGFVQVIAEKSVLGEDFFNEIKKLKNESSLIIEGTVKKDDRSPVGVEILAEKIEIIHEPNEDYPISNKEHGIDFLMENRHLWLRSRKQFHILRVRNQIIKAIREFYLENDFTLIDTPIF
jgi:asparaginyl-tRNA synthetase